MSLLQSHNDSEFALNTLLKTHTQIPECHTEPVSPKIPLVPTILNAHPILPGNERGPKAVFYALTVQHAKKYIQQHEPEIRQIWRFEVIFRRPC